MAGLRFGEIPARWLAWCETWDVVRLLNVKAEADRAGVDYADEHAVRALMRKELQRRRVVRKAREGQ